MSARINSRMMKRSRIMIKRWISKYENYEILLGAMMVLIFVKEIYPEAIVKTIITTIMLPVFLAILQMIMKKILSNDVFNVDVCLSKNTMAEIIWKTENEGSISESSYITVKNCGDINVYSTYIKVCDYKNGLSYYSVTDDLQSKEEICIRIPYRIDEIKSITISCNIPTECRTKHFYGAKSGDEKLTIFGNIEKKDTKREALIYDKGFKAKNEKLIRYRVSRQ